MYLSKMTARSYYSNASALLGLQNGSERWHFIRRLFLEFKLSRADERSSCSLTAEAQFSFKEWGDSSEFGFIKRD